MKEREREMAIKSLEHLVRIPFEDERCYVCAVSFAFSMSITHR